MKTEWVLPKDRTHWLQMKAGDVSSTEISALFGISPYSTEYELWHRKKDGLIVEIDDNERMRWGRRLESAIANGIAEDKGWKIFNLDKYARDSELKAGSSFDFGIDIGQGEFELLEIKNVDALQFREGWVVDGNDLEAPPHIEIQVQHQLMVSRAKRAYIGALIGGNTVKLIRRERDENTISAIKNKLNLFWESIEESAPPPPNFEVDAEFISKLYGYSEPNKVMNLQGDVAIISMATRYKELGEQGKRVDAERDGIKAQILMRLGDCEKGLGDGFTISAGTVGPSEIEAYTRKPYRSFRVTWKKTK